jgi:hypothetical protein
MSDVRLFLSAVTEEFASYRVRLLASLKRPNVEIHVQEQFINSGTVTLDLLDDYIKRCDGIVHIAGDRTGGLIKPASVAWLRKQYPDFARSVRGLGPCFAADAALQDYAGLMGETGRTDEEIRTEIETIRKEAQSSR